MISRVRVGLAALVLTLVVQPLWADSTPNRGGARGLTPADVVSINKQMHALVDEKHAAPGIVTLISQGGKTLDLDAYGLADAQTKAPMRADSVMAIASMTKPITGVAMMILYEQGKWQLDDPIEKVVPEFKNLKVMNDNGQVVAAEHPPTLRQLMSHSAGFTYGFFGNGPVDKLYQQADPLNFDTSLQAMIDKVAKLPLEHQPGTAWEYSVSVDIQGYIVQKLSGQPFDAFVREHITRPLKMKDTDFAILGGDARKRIAFQHAADASGKFSVVLPPGGREGYASKLPGLPSGGGGLFSTAQDYARFCQMLLNRGTLDGVQILKAETVGLMHTNMLPQGMFVSIAGGPTNGTGFGLDFAIAPDPVVSHEPLPPGSYYWSGIYGTYFWIDPVNDMVVVGMIQRAWSPAGGDMSYDPVFVRNQAVNVIYKALAD